MGDRSVCVCVELNRSRMNPVVFQVRPMEAISSHHYLCSCTQELWVMLMHLVEHRNKVLHTRVTTQLRSLFRSLSCYVTPCCANAGATSPVFLELHELIVEAPGFRGAGGGGVQRAPHPLQGPSGVHLVAGHPLGHAGTVLSERDTAERGEKATLKPGHNCGWCENIWSACRI